MPGRTFVMAGGGTGGHVIPLLAVGRELRRRGHEVLFLGTRRGIEARLAPSEGFPIEHIEIGGLKRVGWRQTLITLRQLPLSTLRAARLLRARHAAALFSMGGYAAGPTVIAALWRGIPVVAMEPNALPGFTNRRLGHWVACTLLSFPEAAIHFPKGRTELTGLPVRDEFFALPVKPRGAILNALVTGGSRGARTLNQAARQSWPLFRQAGFPVRMVLQSGTDDYERLRVEFAASGLEGEVVPFIDDMPSAFAAADLVVCRSGAGAVAEIAAAGKPAILVPFPYAADQHQLRNAEAFTRAGAAQLILNQDMNGETLFHAVQQIAAQEGLLERMGQAARRFARPGAAQRAADILEEAARSAKNRLTAAQQAETIH